MGYQDDELIPISALQHLVFCERQCALIHVERLWADNVYTVEGHQLHKKAHTASQERVGDSRVARGLWLVSRRWGLIGQADIVEFRSDGRVVPVEYKRGRPKRDGSDEIQLCAQAICLEEQLGLSIESGCLFYGQRKRRTEVAMNNSLRERTLGKVRRLRELVERHETPPAVRAPKCDKCSLLELCLPNGQRFRRGTVAWNNRQYEATLTHKCPETDEFPFVLSAADAQS